MSPRELVFVELQSMKYTVYQVMYLGYVLIRWFKLKCSQFDQIFKRYWIEYHKKMVQMKIKLMTHFY